jgi:hypothetical protein
MEADVLEMAGLRGADASDETARAARARMVMAVRSIVNMRVCVWSVGLSLIVRLVLVIYLME